MMTSFLATAALGLLAQVQVSGEVRGQAKAEGSVRLGGGQVKAEGKAEARGSASLRIGQPASETPTLGPRELPSVPEAPVSDALTLPGHGTPPRYAGPAPGHAVKNPLPTPPKEGPAQLIWTGFRMAGDRSQLFLQTNGAVEFQVEPAEKKSVSVLLKNCRVFMKNNRRDLDTRFFATPVSRVRTRQRRQDVELKLFLKQTATVTPRTEAGPDGTSFLVLDFPPGTALPPPDGTTDSVGTMEFDQDFNQPPRP